MYRHLIARAGVRSLGSLALFLGAASGAYAAGFALIEQSASGMGNAFAGGSAIAADPSTVYFNPASITRLSGTQMTVAGHLIAPSAKFHGTATINSSITGSGGQPISGGQGGEGGVTALAPNFYYVTDLTETLKFGLGVNAPFGLATRYDKDWVGRYHAIESDLKTVNFNPSLGYRVNDQLSLGMGLSAQYLKAKLSNAIDFASGCAEQVGAICPGLTPGDPVSDGLVKVSGDSWGYGFNLGLLYEFSDRTRLGMAYRSKVSQDLSGKADFSVPASVRSLLGLLGAGNLYLDTGAAASVNLPASASVSLYHDLNDRWSVMGDVTWTGWSSFDKLVITFDNPEQPANVQPEGWKNNMRYSLGVAYKPDSKWTLRSGVAYDATPIPDQEHRTPRIPGNDRTWIAFGAGYKPSERMSVDVGYAHLFVNDTPIDNVEVNTGHHLTGSYKSSVNILSAQVTWKFD